MNGRIQYLNTDLDLCSEEDLTSLTTVFESRGLFPLHVTRGEDDRWYSTLETEQSFEDPESNIAAMLEIIETLELALKSLWDKCSQKEFNIGYDCGSEPWAFQQGLSCENLGRLTAVGASLKWTIYPDRVDANESTTSREKEDK